MVNLGIALTIINWVLVISIILLVFLLIYIVVFHLIKEGKEKE